jgi:hypothetical protein
MREPCGLWHLCARARNALAFLAGSQHLFSSIVVILDPGDEQPTEADLRKMDLIDKELRAFAREMLTTEGSA